MRSGQFTPPILLVSGAAEDDDLWEEVRRFIPDSDIATLANTADVDELCDGVLKMMRGITDDGDNPCVVVGHSLGGAVAVLAADRSPELITGVVVVASGATMPVHPSLWRILEKEGERSVIERFAAATAAAEDDNNRSANIDISTRMRSMMGRAAAGTLTNHLKACDAYAAPTTSVPAVVVAGTHDRLVSPEHSEELAERMGANYRPIVGAGHQLPWERPELIAATAIRLA